jgi:hypothetical protein
LFEGVGEAARLAELLAQLAMGFCAVPTSQEPFEGRRPKPADLFLGELPRLARQVDLHQRAPAIIVHADGLILPLAGLGREPFDVRLRNPDPLHG